MLFTFDSYRKLLDKALQHGFSIHGIEKYLANRKEGFVPEDKFIAIRHDVDYFPGRALELAIIESEYGLETTYYIRRRFFDDKVELIRAIARLKHQIGYHYEEVDTHQKAPNLQIERDAVGFFIGSLLDLDRLGFPIRTVCPHGNPLTDVDNRQVVHLLRDENFLDRIAFTYDRNEIRDKISDRLLGDASIDITGEDFDLYIPDTGRFNPKYNLKDRIDNCVITGLKSIDDFSHILRQEQHTRIYMNMHPDRWSGKMTTWFFDFAFDTAKNMVKKFMGKSSYRGKLVGDKAKKYHQSISKPGGDRPDETQGPRS